MVGKSNKRYFQSQSRIQSRSRSPDDPRYQKASHSKESKPLRTHYEGSSSKFADNKIASERLKKSIVDASSAKPPVSGTTMSRLSVEEQVKRANAIDEINNYNPFAPKAFLSSRVSNSINLLDIPLPKDDNCWRENSKLLIDQSLYIGNAQERRNKWYENMQAIRSQHLS